MVWHFCCTDPCSGNLSTVDGIWGSAIAGLIAALAATTTLGIAKWIRLLYLRRLDMKHLRKVITTGRRRVMESEDIFHRGMNARISAGEFRVGQYNLMLKELGVLLDRATSNLSHNQRDDVLNALDWYNVQSLQVANRTAGGPEFVEIPAGRWPGTDMPKDRAVEKFKSLEAVKWLKLKPYPFD